MAGAHLVWCGAAQIRVAWCGHEVVQFGLNVRQYGAQLQTNVHQSVNTYARLEKVHVIVDMSTGHILTC